MTDDQKPNTATALSGHSWVASSEVLARSRLSG
jgi:hypothetical protein